MFALALGYGCSNTQTQTDAAAEAAADTAAELQDVAADRGEDVVDATAPDVVNDLGADVTADVTADLAADGIADVSDAGTPDHADVPASETASLAGYIRFDNLAPNVGTVRFRARSIPGYVPALIEAVVPEGATSGYIETLPVVYAVEVRAAPGATPTVITDAGPADGGMLTDGGPGSPTTDVVFSDADDDPDAGMLLAERIPGDVYNRSGCTIVFTGRPDGPVDRLQNRRLWRLVDVATRTASTTQGYVRLLSVVPTSEPLNVDQGTTPVGRNLYFFEATGYRNMAAGETPFTVRSAESGALYGMDVRGGTIRAGESATVLFWGLPGDGGAPVRALVQTDLPPGR